MAMNKTTMKIKVWIYVQNLGDGSAIPRFFNSEEDAEKYAENDFERFCDDIYCHTLEVDSDGKLINFDLPYDSEEDDDCHDEDDPCEDDYHDEDENVFINE